MPNRKTKPTSPGRRFAHLPAARAGHRLRAGAQADRGPAQVRRPQRRTAGSPPAIAAAARSGATGRSTSSASRTACRRRSRRSSTTRTAAATSRCSTTPTARSATSSPRTGSRSATRSSLGRGRRHHPGQRPGPARHADRHDRPQRRARPRPGRQARPRRRHRDPAGREGGRHGHPAAALLGDAPGARRVPGDRRHALQRRAPEHQDRQGRPQPPQGQAPADARRRDEPGRPPARRRRGAPHAGRPPGHPVGQADARLQDPQEGQAARTATSCAAAGEERRRADSRWDARRKRARGSRSA